jgi:hypothetical protein
VICDFGKAEYFFRRGLTRQLQNSLSGKSVEQGAEARRATEELRIGLRCGERVKIKCAEDHLAGLRDREAAELKRVHNHRVTFDQTMQITSWRSPDEISKIIGFLTRWQDEMAGVVVELT